MRARTTRAKTKGTRWRESPWRSLLRRCTPLLKVRMWRERKSPSGSEDLALCNLFVIKWCPFPCVFINVRLWLCFPSQSSPRWRRRGPPGEVSVPTGHVGAGTLWSKAVHWQKAGAQRVCAQPAAEPEVPRPHPQPHGDKVRDTGRQVCEADLDLPLIVLVTH